MAGEPARLSLAAIPAIVGGCELCGSDPAGLRAAVLVIHPRGGSVRFNACDRCAQAMRRVLAAIGAPGDVVRGAESAILEPAGNIDAPFVRAPAPLGTVPEGFVDGEGVRYAVRLYGDERADGTWVGWIEFEDTATGVTLRTGRETTQSSWEQLAYWASGLEPSYFDGAFARAR